MSAQPEPAAAGDSRRSRPAYPQPDLDAAEQAWWRNYADVEEEFCWVQTPAIQRFLRGAYLRRIARAVPPGGRALEVGCGTGWLTLQLAEQGAGEVHGVDFSPEQIGRARERARRRPGGAKVHFHVFGAGAAALPGSLPPGRFDVLVLHAVLHHLTDVEVRSVLEQFASRLAAPGARVFIVEPVSYREGDAARTRIDRLVDRLILLPRAGRRSGLRRLSAEEARLWAKIDGRGDSPKEAPFLPGELERLVKHSLRIEASTPVLCFSFLAAKNLLLLRKSHPFWAGLLFWPYLGVVRALECRVLRMAPGSVWLPLFMLFECTSQLAPPPSTPAHPA